MLTDRLIVSECFYSIQGEGKYIGRPAVFLRLAGCNLRCPGFSYKDPNTNEHLGCDTAHIWKHGKHYTVQALYKHFQESGFLAHLKTGAHLVVTGGEPLIQAPALAHFLKIFPPTVFMEIETNGTICPPKALSDRLDLITVSPKLSTAGDTPEKRINPDALAFYAAQDTAIFKFVISQESDIDELITHYQVPLNIPENRIWLMPEGGTQSAIQAKSPWIVEAAKQYHFNYTSREHIFIWGETTGC